MRFKIVMMCLLLSGCQQSQEALLAVREKSTMQDVADLPLASAPPEAAPSRARARARAVLLKTKPPAKISESERRFLRDAGTRCHDPHARQRLVKDLTAEGGAFAGGGAVPFQSNVLDPVHEAQRLQIQKRSSKEKPE